VPRYSHEKLLLAVLLLADQRNILRPGDIVSQPPSPRARRPAAQSHESAGTPHALLNPMPGPRTSLRASEALTELLWPRWQLFVVCSALCLVLLPVLVFWAPAAPVLAMGAGSIASLFLEQRPPAAMSSAAAAQRQQPEEGRGAFSGGA